MGFYPRPMPFGPCAPCPCPPRECHKEFKELLVVPEASRTIPPKEVLQLQDNQSSARGLALNSNIDTSGRTVDTTVDKSTSATGAAIIGGGCCVHLSVEYMPDPSAGAQASDGREVRVRVVDSDNAMLTWTKKFTDGYHVKENIITTKPGATLTLTVADAIARVRWCEIYSG
jgi:hypothetical protein